MIENVRYLSNTLTCDKKAMLKHYNFSVRTILIQKVYEMIFQVNRS